MLLEENTLMGVGAENSANLYSCMGYFANSPSEVGKAFKAEYLAKYGAKAPQLATIGADCYSALNLAKAMFDKAGSGDAKKLTAASEGLVLRHRLGARDDARPAGRQGHVPGELQGHRVRGLQDHQGGQERHRLQGLSDAARRVVMRRAAPLSRRPPSLVDGRSSSPRR